jgi:excisionase family DNA binding protein
MPAVANALTSMETQRPLRTADTGQQPQSSPTLTAREAAALLGASERTVRRAIARGDLVATKRSGVFAITSEEIERYRARSDARMQARRRRNAGPLPPLRHVGRAPLAFVAPERLH